LHYATTLAVTACTASKRSVLLNTQEPSSPSPSTPHLATEEGILSATANVPDGSVPVLPEAPAPNELAVLSTDEARHAPADAGHDDAAAEAGQDDAAAEAAAIAAASSRADADDGAPNMRGVRSLVLSRL